MENLDHSRTQGISDVIYIMIEYPSVVKVLLCTFHYCGIHINMNNFEQGGGWNALFTLFPYPYVKSSKTVLSE